MPYYKYGNGFILLLLFCGIIICFAGTISAFIKTRRNKQSNPHRLDSHDIIKNEESTVDRENMTKKQIAGGCMI
jgi:hypothetical protein